jgi:predicted PurR-regulated permease PerM
MDRRLGVLGGVLTVIAVLAAVILFEVLGTVFFALTVAFLLAPVRRRIRDRGVSRLVTTIVVTAAAFIGVIVLTAPVGYLLFARFGDVLAFLNALPESIPLEFAGFRYDLVVADLLVLAERQLRLTVTSLAAALPVLVTKFALFVLLVFSLLYNESDIRSSVIAVVPPEYRDIANALHERARNTLYALYVLQAVTALATFLIALPVFVVLGYGSPLVLATVAGVLQFIPVAGPSILIAVLVGGNLLTGDIVGAVLIALLGGGLIAWLPDLAIRPRLASRTANINSSLYFIGFVGGLLSLGALGVIVGPLVIDLLAETAGLVADEFDIESEPA